MGDFDGKIEKEIDAGWKAYKRRASDVRFSAYLAHRRKSEKVVRLVTDIAAGLLTAALVAVAVTGFVFRAQGRQFYFGNTTYLTVETGSMSQINAANAYRADLPDNQIARYALIGVTKIAEDDLRVFDIVAFRYAGEIYIHRIVRIDTAADGTKRYTTQGDANNGSFPFEIGFAFERIVGRYNGRQNVGLGAFLTFLQSWFGLIVATFALLMVVLLDATGWRIEKSYSARLEKLCAKRLEAEKAASAVNTEYAQADTTHD